MDPAAAGGLGGDGYTVAEKTDSDRFHERSYP